jgi:hypothetical protein
MFVLWGCLVLTLVNLVGLLETKRKAALGLLPFVLAQGFALRLGHGRRLREAVRALEARRHARWGPGFGWMLVIAGCGLFTSPSVTVLIAVEVARVGGPDLLRLPGVLRLLPAAIGIGAAVFALSRLTRSRAPMAWISAINLVLLAWLMRVNGWSSTAGHFALLGVVLTALLFVALTRRTFEAFRERHRSVARGR